MNNRIRPIAINQILRSVHAIIDKTKTWTRESDWESDGQIAIECLDGAIELLEQIHCESTLSLEKED